MGRAYRRLAGIVEEADDAILAAGPDLRITLFNRGAERMFGYCAAEILGQPLELLIPDRFRAEHAGHVERFAKCEVRARRMRERSQIIARRKNGEEFPAEASILKLQVNGAMEFAAIVRDASARKREENALRRLKEQAEVASRAKSRFLANMGHELRTPLNAIIGFSQVMLKGIHGPLGHPRYEDYVASILESGELLLEILNDILDMSKIEAGKIVAHPTELAIEDAVNSVLRVLAGRAAAANIRLCGELAQGLPRIRADERMVRQILLNLVSNAIKFTPEGGDVLVSAGREPGGEVVLVVADTGIGMAAADIPKALEPFGQIDSALARRHPGTGLGLPLVKSMVELHGGTLAIDSREGAGTTVTVCFPAAIALDPPAPAAGSEETRHPHAGGTDAARAARVAAGC